MLLQHPERIPEMPQQLLVILMLQVRELECNYVNFAISENIY